MVDAKQRTDIHRPSVVQPEDYVFIACENVKLDGDIGACFFIQAERERIRNHMAHTGGTYSSHNHGGNCHICGAHCIYTALFYHEKTNTYIRTGFDCAEKMFTCDSRTFKTYREACKDALRAKAGRAKAEEILKEEGLEKAWTIWQTDQIEEPKGDVAIIRDIVGKIIRYGNPTKPQINFLRQLVDRVERWPEIQAQRAKERESAEDCPEGRLEITGTILSIKEKEYDFGSRWVMTVKDDRGFLVWGTLPKAFGTTIRGAKVKFSAAVTPSDSDSKFGFYKRPTKAEVLENTEEDQ
jgi:hypothetical protein